MPRDLDRNLRDGPDETGRPMPENIPAPEFQEPAEERSMPRAPEFTPPPDEFDPKPVITENEREYRRYDRRGRMAFVRTAVMAVIGLVLLTSAVRAENQEHISQPSEPSETSVVSQTEKPEVDPGGKAYTPGPGDPSLVIDSAVLDGDSLVYTYSLAMNETDYPFTLYAKAVDGSGRTAEPASGPDVWDGSRVSFDYSLDVSGLELPMKLILTGTFSRDGQEGSVTAEKEVIAMPLVITEAELSASPASDGSTIFFTGRIIPHSGTKAIDAETVSFNMVWYDANGERIGGTGSIGGGVLPDAKFDDFTRFWEYAYSGSAETDLAPDEAESFSCVLTVRDRTTGAQILLEPEPVPIPREEPIPVRTTLVQIGTWGNSAGSYCHFNSDGTGWVYDGNYFGYLSFTGDDESVSLSISLTTPGGMLTESSEKSSWHVYRSVRSNAVITGMDLMRTPDDSFALNLDDPYSESDFTSAPGPSSFDYRPASLTVNTAFLDSLRGKTAMEAIAGYSWGIKEEYKPSDTYGFGQPYAEVVYLMPDGTGGAYIKDTVGATFGKEAEISAVPVDETAENWFVVKIILDEPGFTYSYSEGTSSYSFTLENYDSEAALCIREDGVELVLTAPYSGYAVYFRYED